MIDIHPLASSSAANAYRVSDGTTTLLLDAGLPFKSLQIAMNFRLSDVSGVLITHGHGDHVKAAKDLATRAGMDIYAPQSVLEAMNIPGHRAKPVTPKQAFTLGTWTVLPFQTEHDVESVGYLLANQVGEKLVFLTDTFYCRYRFNGLTHIMVEANYSERILNENIAAGRVPREMKKRIIRSHFSLENVKEFLRANDLSKVQEIWLIHLSDINSDEALFKREIQELTGKQVLVAGR